MKKTIYIILCGILGVMLGFILQTILEVPVIYVVVSDFEKFSFGLSWEKLMILHWIFTLVLLMLGLIFGIRKGFVWWKYIYVDKKWPGIYKHLMNKNT